MPKQTKRPKGRALPRSLAELEALPADAILSVGDAARLIGRAKQTIYHQALYGYLQCEQVGSAYCYRKKAVLDYATRLEKPGWPKGVKRLAVIHKALEITIPPAVQEYEQGQ